MEENSKNKALSNQGKSKARKTDNRQSKPARRRQVQSVSAKESVDLAEQIRVREALRQSLEQAERSQHMVLALSQAAQGISRAHTIEGVCQAIQEQSSRLGYQTTGLELTADGKLQVVFTGYKPGLIRKIEKLTGFSQRDYRFSPRKGSIYQRVLFHGETVHIQDSAQAVAEALPSKMHALARQIADIVGLAPTTFAPLIAGEETLGVLAFTAPDLTVADNPAIIAFAGQAAIAMQNARLCEAAQKEIAEHKQAEENLRKSEERYRLISNVASDYVFSTMVEEDGSLKLNWVAGAFETITGYTFEEYVAHGGWRAMLHPDDREVDNRDLQTLHKNRKTISELRTLKKDGSVFWVRVYAHPIWDERARRLVGIYGAVQNINERKQAEVLLRKSEERYRDLVENIRDLICTHDLQGNILFVNQAPAKLLGYAPKELIGLNLRDLLSPKVRDRFDTYLSSIQRDGSASGFMQVLTKNGEMRLWEYNNTLRTEDIDVPIVRGLARDVTERKRAEEALQQSEEKYRELIDGMTETVWVIDFNGNLIDVNKTAVDVLGYSKEELLTVGLYGIDSSLRKEEIVALSNAMPVDKIQIFETSHTTKDGRTFPVEIYSSLVTYQGNRAILSIARDITERVRAEEKLRESEEKVKAQVSFLDSVMEQSPFAMWISDKTGTVIRTNRVLRKTLNLTDEQILGKYNVLKDDNLKEQDVMPQVRAVFKEQRPARFSIPWGGNKVGDGAFKDAHDLWIDVSIFPVVDSEGNLTNVVCQWVNISEQVRGEEMLREERDRFTKIAATVPGLICSFRQRPDGSAHMPYASPVSQDVVGFQPEDIAQNASTLLALIHPDDVGPVNESFAESARSLSPWRKEFRYKHPQKGEIWIEGHSMPQRAADGSTIWHGVLTDITERKRMEVAIHQSEEQFKTLFMSLSDGFYISEIIYDDNGNPCDYRYVEVNPKFEQIMGMSRDQIVGKRYKELVPVDTTQWFDNYCKVARTGVPRIYEFYSNEYHMHFETYSYQPVKGQISVFVRDITERKQAETALRESEQRFRQLFVASPDALMLIDPYDLTVNWPIVDCNDVACQMSGYTREELVGKSVDILNITKGTPQERSAYLERIRRSGVFHLESFHRHRDGHIYPVEISTSIVTFKGRELVLGIDRDITERKQAEEALRESEDLYRRAIETAGAVPYREVYPIAGERPVEYQFIGEGIRQITGYGPEEFNAALWEDLTLEMHPLEDLAGYSVEEAVQRVRSGRNPIWKCDFKIQARDGTIHWVFEAAVELRDEHGISHGSIGMYQDITARKQAEEQLRRSEATLKKAQQVAHVGSWAWHIQENWLEWSDEMYSIFGIEKESFTSALSDVIARAIHPEDRAKVELSNLSVINENKPVPLEYRVVWPDGTVRLVWAEAGELILDEGGNPLTLTGITQDITERKQAEEALAASEAELRALFASMQDVVLVIDREGVYREIAPTNPGLLYKPPQELLGQNLCDVFSAEQAETFIGVIRQTLETGQTTRIEYELAIGERPIWFSTSISPMNADSTLWVAHDITEQKQAETEIRRRAEEFTALYDTSMSLSAEHDLTTLLQTIVENAVTMLNAYAGGMYLYDPVREELEVTFATEPSMPVGTRLRLGEGVAGRVAQTQQSMRIEDYSTWEGRSQKYEGIAVRATIEVPMLYKGELIGVLVAHETGASKRQFTEADEHLLSLFAFQAAAAIQNARLFEQERARARELSMLYEATKTISSDLTLESVLETIAEKMAQILRSDGCTLSLLNREQDALVTLVDYRTKHPERAEAKGVIYYLDKYPASRRVLESGQPLAIDPMDKETDQSELAHMTKRWLAALLMLPLVVHDQAIGLVEIYEEERERAYKQEEIQLLQSLAAQAAISIENARLFEDAQRRLKQTKALREIDQAITGSVDMQHVLKIVLKHTINELGVDAAVILLYDPKEQGLHYELGSGFQADSLQFTHLRLGEGYAGRAALGKQTIYIPDLRVRNTDFLRSPTFHQEGFVCYFGVPLIAKGEIMGVLEIFHRTPLNPDIEWLSFMETLAGQVAIAIDNATLYKNLQHSNVELSLAYDATIEGWSRALDLRDRETEGHTLRVTELTRQMAEEMGMGEEELVHIRRGALLHDIGKMGVPDRILLKPDTLTDEEWKIMHKHPIFAYEMLSPIGFLLPALDIPYCHHEKWDGTGYPRKLKGDEIPLVARIFAVVDVWDALTSNRPYRPAWTKDQALEHIQEQSGKHFDPNVVEVFLKLIAKG
jgi:PAS domain S-box-containing protein/putative nucleotidyltransferase with HDIG domain